MHILIFDISFQEKVKNYFLFSVSMELGLVIGTIKKGIKSTI